MVIDVELSQNRQEVLKVIQELKAINKTLFEMMTS